MPGHGGVAAIDLGSHDRITVLSGAGISTESGIPDFRGPRGVWTRDPEAEKLLTLQNYLAEPDVRRRAWAERAASPAWAARPNAGHRALLELEDQGRLVGIVTQNIDGLHQQAGNRAELVIEVHGTMHQVVCMSCAARTPMTDALDRLRAGELDPECRDCAGILKAATISFGQQLDPDVVDHAVRAAQSCTALVAVGTSLTVHPVAGLVEVAADAGARIVIVNAQPTPYDDLADAVIREPIGTALPALLGSMTPQ